MNFVVTNRSVLFVVTISIRFYSIAAYVSIAEFIFR